ncbi:hypothetical protein ASF24_08240 [Methylobacterium sp. Leaf86]|nr:hypothetical protein ASF24_08240 [Methylobacterium sp. Leaf86]
MIRTSLAVVVVILTAGSALAWDDGTRERNALNDMARAQERQARALERLEQQHRDTARAQDRKRHNAEVMSRSRRRFD